MTISTSNHPTKIADLTHMMVPIPFVFFEGIRVSVSENEMNILGLKEGQSVNKDMLKTIFDVVYNDDCLVQQMVDGYVSLAGRITK